MTQLKLISVAAALVLSTTAPALAQQGTGPGWGHGYWDGPWHGWFMGPIMMLVFLALVALVVVLVIRWVSAPTERQEASRQNAALDILKERFARGEIDKTEFEERRKVLEG